LSTELHRTGHFRYETFHAAKEKNMHACKLTQRGSVAIVIAGYIASQLGPEMEPVWLWFDQLLGASVATNPRNYCNF
jgi:hypothetical protein